jgi:aldose 1-epimerase
MRRGAVCLETQFFPDSPNKPGFPPCVFKEGQTFESATAYQFIADGNLARRLAE